MRTARNAYGHSGMFQYGKGFLLLHSDINENGHHECLISTSNSLIITQPLYLFTAKVLKQCIQCSLAAWLLNYKDSAGKPLKRRSFVKSINVVERNANTIKEYVYLAKCRATSGLPQNLFRRMIDVF
jgi:hypothetical protein